MRCDMKRVLVIGFCSAFASTAPAADGDTGRGQQFYSRACSACHSLKPDTNMTGPSLAGLFGRKAGGLASFSRYSPAMKAAQHVWDYGTLDTC
jgi:cytochrome c